MNSHRTNEGDKLHSDWGFRLMSLEFRLRDFFRPRKNILQEAGIKLGFRVLDYGCGPGGYVVAAAEAAGKTGKVYALDAHPLAIKSVQGIIGKKHLGNVEVILSDCKTGLPENSLDLVLLYDTLHDLADPACVLGEIYRVLKNDGRLSMSDHHLEKQEIVSRMTARGLFSLSMTGRKTYLFSKSSSAKYRTSA